MGSYFKKQGYAITAGDVLAFAHAFQVARIELDHLPPLHGVLAHVKLTSALDVESYLDSRKARDDSWFPRNYAKQRRFFTLENARRIAGAWNTIRTWTARGLLSTRERLFLLASLIDSADKVANTAGTYYAYLKSWHRKAVKPFRYRFLTPTPGTQACTARRTDALVLASEPFDVLYLDPPYNSRSHAHYYHLPESLALAITPRVHGCSGIPDNFPVPSRFNRVSTASKALAELLLAARSKVIVLHYSPTGHLTPRQIRESLSRYKRIETHRLTAPGYTTRHERRRTPHVLYVATNG